MIFKVFKITEWLENEVFVNLEKRTLNAFNFIILSSPTTESDDCIDPTTEDYEASFMDDDSYNLHDDHDHDGASSTLEVFTFNFLDEQEKVNDQSSPQANNKSVTEQVQTLFTSLLDLLVEVERRKFRRRVSINFVLEFKKNHEGNHSSSCSSMSMSQGSSMNADTKIITTNPITRIIDEVRNGRNTDDESRSNIEQQQPSYFHGKNEDGKNTNGVDVAKHFEENTQGSKFLLQDDYHFGFLAQQSCKFIRRAQSIYI